MWVKPGQREPIDPSQLVTGLYVELAMDWDAHPFVSNRFMIASQKQIDTIRTLSVQGKLFYYPNKSSSKPADSAAGSQENVRPEAEQNATIDNEVTQLKKEKKERLQLLKDAAARADRAWEMAAKATREAMLGMDRSPKQAGVQLKDLSIQTAREIANGQEILLHLLGDKEGEGPQFHALNVMTLGMLIGKEAGFNEEQLAELALGLLAHDIGKARIPLHLLKAKSRAKHEEDFYRSHGVYGLEMAKVSGVFGPVALSVIADHHEYLDGSGWPTRTRSARLLVLRHWLIAMTGFVRRNRPRYCH
jgi:HD-GYP domain-containing protein (c-di-GMP phosphodiesterase class II)